MNFFLYSLEGDLKPNFIPNVEFKYTPFPDIEDILEKCKKAELEEEVDIMSVDDNKEQNGKILANVNFKVMKSSC